MLASGSFIHIIEAKMDSSLADTFFVVLLRNKPLVCTFLSWALAQGYKIVTGLIRERHFDFNWILRTGGMPSAHSAAVSALAFCVGKEMGFASPMFALASLFALITMFDAQTWRRSIGVQARILNRIMEDIHNKGQVEESKLKELIGHSPIEVFVGALLGVATSYFFYR